MEKLNKNIISTTILFFILFLFFTTLHAGEITVKKNIQLLPNDISAQQYQQTDKNDDPCAIVKVRTQIQNIDFDSRLGITGKVEYKGGEYWIYLSYGERVLQIMHEELIRLDYLFPFPLESGSVYFMEIDAEFSNKNQEEIDYSGYLSILSSSVDTKGASIFINGKDIGRTVPAIINLNEGDYTVHLTKNDFEDSPQQSVLIRPKENMQIIFDMQKIDPLKQYKKELKTKKYLSGALSIISLGCGIYCTLEGNSAYNTYSKSTDPDEISHFKKVSKRLDTAGIISYSVSLSSLTWFVTNMIKFNKTKKALSK